MGVSKITADIQGLIKVCDDGTMVLKRPRTSWHLQTMLCKAIKTHADQGLYMYNDGLSEDGSNIFYWCLISNTVKHIATLKEQAMSGINCFINNTSVDDIVCFTLGKVYRYRGGEIVFQKKINTTFAHNYVFNTLDLNNRIVFIESSGNVIVFDGTDMSELTSFVIDSHVGSASITTYKGKKVIVAENHRFKGLFYIHSIEDGALLGKHSTENGSVCPFIHNYVTMDGSFFFSNLANDNLFQCWFNEDGTPVYECVTEYGSIVKKYKWSSLEYFSHGMKVISIPIITSEDAFVVLENYNDIVDTKPAVLI